MIVIWTFKVFVFAASETTAAADLNTSRIFDFEWRDEGEILNLHSTVLSCVSHLIQNNLFKPDNNQS